MYTLGNDVSFEVFASFTVHHERVAMARGWTIFKIDYFF